MIKKFRIKKMLFYYFGQNFDGEDIQLNIPGEVLKNLLEHKCVIILKHVFDPEKLKSLVHDIHSFGQKYAPTNPEFHTEVQNFHRIDENPPLSKVKRIIHSYHSFYWNSEIADEFKYLKAMMRLRNYLTGLPLNYAMNEISDGYISSPQIMQYPRGGGYMCEHIDPPLRQACVISTMLTSRGHGYEKGGFYLRTPDGKKIDVDQHCGIGDVIIFHPSLCHGVDPIDPDTPLDWNSISGRWMMFSTLVEATSLNGGECKGLKQISSY
jgi:hypothetical protein